MERVGLTERMRDALDFIDVTDSQRGCSPSYDEIKDHLGLSSRSRVSELVACLEERGYIVRRPFTPRSLALTDAGREERGAEGFAGPLTGYEPAAGAFHQIQDETVATAFSNGWSTHDIADHYAEHGLIVLEAHIASALKRARDGMHSERSAA